MSQYYVLTLDPKFLQVAQWIRNNKVRCEVHLNRTRFWIDDLELEMMFLLQWADVCPKIEERADGDYALY